MNPRHPEPSIQEDPARREHGGLVLEILEPTFGICRLSRRSRVPRWLHRSSFSSVSRSPDEMSIVCEDALVPDGVRCERGWKAIRVVGTLDLSLIGVLASLAQPLAEARIGLFTVSTFDTDYLLVREKKLEEAKAVLEAAGHSFDREPVYAPAPESEPDEREDAAKTRAREPAPKTPAAASRDVPSRAATPEDATPEDATPEDATPEDATPEDATPEDAAPATVTPEAPAAVPGDRPVDAESGDDAPRPRRASRRDSRGEARDDARREARDDARRDQRREARDDARRDLRREARDDARRDQRREARDDERDEGRREARDDARRGQRGEARRDDRREARDEGRGRDARSSDEGARADGLFTGAIPQHPVETTDLAFDELGLSAPIIETVKELGFEHPTPIQARVIPHALEGKDVIGLAETGSGKTAAFSLPLAERLTHGKGIRGLILCPTREIALQTKAFLDIFGRDHELETVVVIGGVRMGPQISGLRRTPDIIVATPGRLADHLRRGNVKLDKLEELVLDEADHMLDLGFLPQIREILEQLPDDHRTMMFSATMPPPIQRLARIFMREPERVDLRPSNQIATGIEHRLYLVDEDDKKDCLVALLNEIEGSTLVFSRRKLYTEWLARQLENEGFPVARIHSDRSQAQRVQALRGFREGRYRILAATDVAARGIDVPRIQHVVNYDLPAQVEDYVHRAGRTARGSAGGIVSTIGTWQDKIMVRDIELTLGIKMPRCTVDGVKPYVELPKRKTVRRRRLL